MAATIHYCVCESSNDERIRLDCFITALQTFYRQRNDCLNDSTVKKLQDYGSIANLPIYNQLFAAEDSGQQQQQQQEENTLLKLSETVIIRAFFQRYAKNHPIFTQQISLQLNDNIKIQEDLFHMI